MEGWSGSKAGSGATLARSGSLTGKTISQEAEMREHSGAEGKNNNRNPTLREQEEAKGKSGEAIHGDKKVGSSPSRKSTAGA